MKILKHRKVLGKELLRALENGDEIMEEAASSAGRIIEEARREAEILKAEARKEGFEEGKATASEIICSAEAQKEKMLADMERDIVDLAVETAASIIQRCRETDPAAATELYRKALEHLRFSGGLTLRVSPADHEAAAAFVRNEIEGEKGHANVKVVADGSVSPGGCVVESEGGKVDGRIEKQLEAVKKALEAKIDR